MYEFNDRSIPIAYSDEVDAVILDHIADDLLNSLPAAQNGLKIMVTIPAHNEEHFIQNCIKSLTEQRTVGGRAIDSQLFEILILCHNCTDATYKIVKRMALLFPKLNLQVIMTERPEINNVGAVRRVLMRIASSRIHLKTGYIAMTDADSMVHPYWLANLFGYIGSGYGLICGKIEVDTKNLSQITMANLALKLRYDHLWIILKASVFPDQIDPIPKHACNSGPNMAVRADVYNDINGIDPLGFCEDVAFYDKVIWNGYAVRHCPMTMVTTSGRTEARAPWGFGAELHHWNEGVTKEIQVENLKTLLVRLEIYHSMWNYARNGNESDLQFAIHGSGIDCEKLLSHVQKFSQQRALFLRLEKDLDNSENWRRHHPLIKIQTACSELENYLSKSSKHFCQTSNL